MKNKNFITFLGISLASFVAYFFTAPPSVYTGDSGEIATAVYTWGIAHPTGFPAYLILSKLFSYLLPWLEFAFRLNIFSAICGAATVGILFLILQKLKINYLASIAASLSLAFGFTFWTHSTMLQVYSLTALFFTLAIFIFLHWLEIHPVKSPDLSGVPKGQFNRAKKPSDLYLLAAICGIGAGTHLSFVLIAPFLLIFAILMAIRKEFPLKSIKHIFFSLFLGVAVASAIYAYIPWRAAANPDLNWGNPSTKESFINYITQQDYSDKIGTRSLESWKLMLGEVGQLFSREFTWLGLIFVLIGAIVAWKKNRPFFYAGASVIFFNILLLGNYGNSQDIMILWRYFLPSYIIMAVFMAMAINTALSKRSESKGYTGALCLLFPAIIFFAHFGACNYHRNYLVQNVTRDIFNSVSQNAILVTDGDTLVGSTMYEQSVLGKRKDLILINDKLFTYPWYQEAKKKELEARGKKYANNVSYLIRDNADTDFFAIINSSPLLKMNYNFFPHGMVYRVISKKETMKLADFVEKNKSFWQEYNYEFLKDRRFLKYYFENEIVKIYIGALINLAAYLTNNGDVAEGINYFEKSLKIRENKSALYNLAGIYNELGDKKKAMEYKERLDKIK